MSETDSQPPVLPEIEHLLKAVDSLTRERRVLAEAIESVEAGQTKKALQKLKDLAKQSEQADTELRSCLTHLQLYFAIFWAKAERDKPFAQVIDVMELLQLFGIKDIRNLGHLKSPEDERLAEQILAKVEADLEAQNRVDSAKPVANQLRKLGKAADKKNFNERAALLYAATSFVLLGLEDIAMHHLLPLLKMLQNGPAARHHEN